MNPLRLSLILIVLIFTASPLFPTRATADEGDQPAHPLWFKTSLLDLRSDLAEANRAGKTGILVFFHTPSCTYCKALLRTTFSDPTIVERLRTEFDTVALDVLSTAEVTAPDGRSYWVKDYAVDVKATFTPTLIFFGSHGKPLLRLVGYYPPERFGPVLDYLQEGRYEFQTLRAYLAERQAPRAAPAGYSGRRDPAFLPPPYIFDRRLAPGERPLVVVFERDPCAPCERLQRVLRADPSVRELLRRFEAVRLNMDDSETRLITPSGDRISVREWAELLGLLHAPALVYFDERGREVLRVDSDLLIDAHGRPVEDADPEYVSNVAERFRYVLTKGYREFPQFQQWRLRQTAQFPDIPPEQSESRARGGQ